MNVLTVKECAEKLRVSQGTVYALVAQAILPAVRIGGFGRGTIRILESDLQDFIQNSRTKARPPSAALRHIRSGA